MITIQEFADLCACSTQTLRYYDRINLLKPAQVDPWSRYRYYERAQAIDFVKIKNLQLADFTIEEIKTLLQKSDQEVYDAFTKKIAEQQHKLDQIKKIQQSYLREKIMMEKLALGITDFLLNQITDFEELREFGLDPKDGDKILALVRAHLQSAFIPQNCRKPEDVTLTVGENIVQGADQVLEKIKALDSKDLDGDILLSMSEDHEKRQEELETLWEYHDWQHIYEFIDQIPALDKDQEYQLFFQLQKEGGGDVEVSVSLPMFMIGALLMKNGECKGLKGCTFNPSEDGKNHFALKRIVK